MKQTVALMVLLAGIAGSGRAWATGLLVPTDVKVPPLAVKYLRVQIDVENGVANTRIEQVFKNSTDRDLEAVYVFPLPAGAAVADFALYINGKRTSGELLEREKARGIYQDIVRRMKDPGLLEYMGGSLFKASIYPVPRNGEQRIELAYTHTLPFEDGVYRCDFPLRTGDAASRTLEDFTVGVRLASAVPIKTVYSPSHKIGVTRKSDNNAVIGFEESSSVLDRDFVLYYGISKKEFGINLLAHAVEGKDGYFLMMLSPSVKPPKGEVVKRDVVFVPDTSGSMSGEKIRQAREAIKFCINRLNEGDRFNIVRFSTDVDTFEEGMVEVTDAARKKALEFVDKFEAAGGTNLEGAMAAALKARGSSDRPGVIIVLTDGKPTLGVTDNDIILKNIKTGNSDARGARVFVFGVGEDLNAHLLDKVAGENGGVCQYVAPNEDIEVKVSAFYNKIANPVLSKPRVAVDKLKIFELHPQELPDLFAGEQVILFGRYSGKGDYAIRLTGEVNGKQEEFVYEGSFPAVSAANEFIPRLWATRRVGYLLDQIRLHGEERELKDEVLRLSREFGIVTPYTSYLVVEDTRPQPGGEAPAPMPRRVTPADAAFGPPAMPRASGGSGDIRESDARAAVPVFDEKARDTVLKGQSASGKVAAEATGVGDQGLRKEEGQAAIGMSQAIRSYRYAETDNARGDARRRIQHVEGRNFYWMNGYWVDESIRDTMKIRTVTCGSSEYFELIEKNPTLKKFFTLGEKVKVRLDDNTVIVVEAE